MADFSVTLAVEGPVKGTIGVSISLDDFLLFYFFHDQQNINRQVLGFHKIMNLA